MAGVQTRLKPASFRTLLADGLNFWPFWLADPFMTSAFNALPPGFILLQVSVSLRCKAGINTGLRMDMERAFAWV